MSEYKMTNKHDCGPCAIAAVTDIPLETVKKTMGWRDFNDSRDDLLDSPAAHFNCLKTLGVPYRIVTCGDIMSGKCANGKTVILLHGTGIINAWLQQHWTVLYRVTDIDVHVYMGDGSARYWDMKAFQAVYASGGPTATAYEVGVSGPTNTRWNWWGKLMKWMWGNVDACRNLVRRPGSPEVVVEGC